MSKWGAKQQYGVVRMKVVILAGGLGTRLMEAEYGNPSEANGGNWCRP